LTTTEQHYVQIEKQALAITWAYDKFACYIIGLKIQIETDHKPLISFLGSKHLDDLPSYSQVLSLLGPGTCRLPHHSCSSSHTRYVLLISMTNCC